MHRKKSLLYIILYSIYSIIYYLFVVLLLGFYFVFSSNLARKIGLFHYQFGHFHPSQLATRFPHISHLSYLHF